MLSCLRVHPHPSRDSHRAMNGAPNTPRRGYIVLCSEESTMASGARLPM